MTEKLVAAISVATRISCLDRRTLHAAVGTKNATVTGIWFDQVLTGFTLVEPLAGVCGHDFTFSVPASRAGNLRFQNEFIHWTDLHPEQDYSR